MLFGIKIETLYLELIKDKHITKNRQFFAYFTWFIACIINFTGTITSFFPAVPFKYKVFLWASWRLFAFICINIIIYLIYVIKKKAPF